MFWAGQQRLSPCYRYWASCLPPCNRGGPILPSRISPDTRQHRAWLRSGWPLSRASSVHWLHGWWRYTASRCVEFSHGRSPCRWRFRLSRWPIPIRRFSMLADCSACGCGPRSALIFRSRCAPSPGRYLSSAAPSIPMCFWPCAPRLSASRSIRSRRPVCWAVRLAKRFAVLPCRWPALRWRRA